MKINFISQHFHIHYLQIYPWLTFQIICLFIGVVSVLPHYFHLDSCYRKNLLNLSSRILSRISISAELHMLVQYYLSLTGVCIVLSLIILIAAFCVPCPENFLI